MHSKRRLWVETFNEQSYYPSNYHTDLFYSKLFSLSVSYLSVFGTKQVTSAQQAAKKVDQELQALQATLKDIESARPFDELTTSDVAKARPEITKAVEEMVKNGKWTTPGYGEKVSFTNQSDNKSKRQKQSERGAQASMHFWGNGVSSSPLRSLLL